MYRIFALDDDQEILNQLKLFIKEMNFEILVETKPTEVLKSFKKDSNFDLLIVDVNMPEMDGFTFAQKVNESFPYSRIPIMFLTASNSIEDVKKATAIGASGYIIKPLVKKALLDKLEHFFSSHIRISDSNRLRKISEDSMLNIVSPVEIIFLDEQTIVLESLEAFPFNAKYEFKSQVFKQVRLDSITINLKSQIKNEEKNTWITEFKIAEMPSSKVEPFKALLKFWKAKAPQKNAV